MKLTGLEWEVVQNVPLEGFHLALLFLLPLLATFILLLVSRRYFTSVPGKRRRLQQLESKNQEPIG